MNIVVQLDEGAIMPRKSYAWDAGFDLFAPYDFRAFKDRIRNAEPQIIDTGVHILIPHGYCGQILPRSSMNERRALVKTGVIDAGYTGSIEVVLQSTDFDTDSFYRPAVYRSEDDEIGETVYINDITIRRGDRIAQLVIVPVPEVTLVLGDVKVRGDKGFGSTGV